MCKPSSWSSHFLPFWVRKLNHLRNVAFFTCNAHKHARQEIKLSINQATSLIQSFDIHLLIWRFSQAAVLSLSELLTTSSNSVKRSMIKWAGYLCRPTLSRCSIFIFFLAFYVLDLLLSVCLFVYFMSFKTNWSEKCCNEVHLVCSFTLMDSNMRHNNLKYFFLTTRSYVTFFLDSSHSQLMFISITHLFLINLSLPTWITHSSVINSLIILCFSGTRRKQKCN